MKLCMIGTGYVGLVSGVCFSDVGNKVYCVDKDEKKIDLLNNGKVPIYEPGLEEILKKNHRQKRLIFTSDLKKAVNNSDIIFICLMASVARAILPKINFRGDHQIISVMAHINRDELISYCLPAKNICITIPLPFVAKGDPLQQKAKEW